MITLKDWLEAINYRITGGDEFGWNCFGNNARMLDSWDNNQDGVHSSVIFDTVTQEVYVAEVNDYARNSAYRLVNPVYNEARISEARARDVDDDVAWDEVNFVDLETDTDFLEKCRAIMNYEDYDARVSIPLEMDQDSLFRLMKLAHERDITFNQLVEQAILNALDEFEQDPIEFVARVKEYARG